MSDKSPRETRPPNPPPTRPVPRLEPDPHYPRPVGCPPSANRARAQELKRELQKTAPSREQTASNRLPIRQVKSESSEDPEILPDAASVTRKRGTSSEMSKPVLFYGKPHQLPDVITYVTVKSIADSITDPQAKSGLLASLFRGPALTWLTDKLESVPKILDDYDEFLGQVRTDFELDQHSQTAQAARQLANLRQRNSVQDYALKFRQLAAKAGLPNATSIAYFVKGLKPNVRSAIVLNDAQTELSNTIEEAVRIDSQLFYSGRGTFTASGKSGKRQGRNNKGQFTGTKVKQEYSY
jgi:hypothetical protein